MVVALVITHDAWSLVPLSTVALGVLRWRVPFADLFRR
jgi:hypothetical protein